jgi:hypothetical protein
MKKGSSTIRRVVPYIAILAILGIMVAESNASFYLKSFFFAMALISIFSTEVLVPRFLLYSIDAQITNKHQPDIAVTQDLNPSTTSRLRRSLYDDQSEFDKANAWFVERSIGDLILETEGGEV